MNAEMIWAIVILYIALGTFTGTVLDIKYGNRMKDRDSFFFGVMLFFPIVWIILLVSTIIKGIGSLIEFTKLIFK